MNDETSLLEGRSWSDVFHKSKISPYVFIVAKSAQGDVLSVVHGLDMPEASWTAVFSDGHWSWPLLDGAVAKFRGYGLPKIPSGVRVYGHNAMRLLCHFLDLRAPTRPLKGEDTVPTLDELVARLDRQRRADSDELLAQAKTAMASHTHEVLQAVHSFFGDDAVDLSQAGETVMPGRGAWGDAGFSRAHQAEYEREGVVVSEAVEWRKLGAEAEKIVRCHRCGRDRLLPMLQAGAYLDHALDLAEAGYDIGVVEPYLRVGCWSGCIREFIKAHFEPECWTEFKTLGLQYSAREFAAAGILPLEARVWTNLGASAWAASVIASRGGTPTDAAELVETGVDLNEYARTLVRQGAA